MKYLILLIFITIRVQAQTIPQICDNSCWAASLAMVSAKVDTWPKTQCHFINLKAGISNCDCVRNRKIIDSDMFTLTKESIYGYEVFSRSSLSLTLMKSLFDRKKPIIYDYVLAYNDEPDSDESHIVVMDSLEEIKNLTNLETTFQSQHTTQLLRDNDRNLSLIRIKDPWPKNVGNEYFITYERYYNQGDNERGKYTISYTDSCRVPIYRTSTAMRNYLNRILFNTDSNKLVQTLLKNIANSPGSFSPLFYRTVNFNKALSSSSLISNEFDVLSVNIGTFLNGEISITTLLNNDYYQKISCISQQGVVKTIVSTSSLNSPVEGMWIIYHIENGKRYQTMLEVVGNYNLQANVKGQEGIILQAANTFFALLKAKDRNEYYVFDLYGDGFGKITNTKTNNRIMKFKDFNMRLYTYLKNNE